MAKLVDVFDINIPLDDRARQTFPPEKSKELANDIIENGLYHAPIVTELPEPVEGPKGLCHYNLVAGHRRLIAIRNIHTREREFTYNRELIPHGKVPVTLAQDDDPLTLVTIELHENIIRLDLDWREKDAAIAKLHELRQSQNPKHTIKDTAKEIKGSDENPGWEQRKVSDAVARYKHRDDPDVAAAPTEKEAMKIILRKHEETIRRATRRPDTKIQSPHRLLFGTAQEQLSRLPSNTYATIITDPPYGIDAEDFGGAAKHRHRYSDREEIIPELYDTLFREASRILLESAHIYVFCDLDHFYRLREVALEHDFKPWRTPLVWYKGSRGHLPSGTNSGWRRSYEVIFHATRGARLHTLVANDVIEANFTEEKIHAAQKPQELYMKLLKMSCYPGEHILDPFCGSGPIFSAARQLSLKATGIEMDEEWVKHIEAVHTIQRVSDEGLI